METYCGLYCGACNSYQVTKKNLTEEASVKWKMKVEDLSCKGCKSDVVSVYCRKCNVKSCAEEHQIRFCFECDDYPCKKLLKFKSDHPHHDIILVNLERIRQAGITQWLAEQETRWTCKNCGENYTWYDETCPKCGQPVESCMTESKHLSLI